MRRSILSLPPLYTLAVTDQVRQLSAKRRKVVSRGAVVRSVYTSESSPSRSLCWKSSFRIVSRTGSGWATITPVRVKSLSLWREEIVSLTSYQSEKGSGRQFRNPFLCRKSLPQKELGLSWIKFTNLH